MEESGESAPPEAETPVRDAEVRTREPVGNPAPLSGDGTGLPFTKELTAGTLANGLRWYVKKNREPQNRAELRLAVRVGSISEQEHERGIAHIIEHLAFRATAKYPNQQDVVNYLERIGAQFGPCQNAYTSFEETVFELHIPVDKSETLETSLGVLAEWAAHIRISDKDVDDERTIVLEEWRQQQTAAMRAVIAYTQALAGEDSIYATRMPIGLTEVIKNVPGSVLRDFYRRFYVPGNMAVVCVGDFPVPEADVIAMIAKIFGSLPAAPVETPAPLHMAPWRALTADQSPMVLILPDDETTSSSVTVDVQMQRYIVRTEADYRISIVRDLFHRAVNNRLFKISLQSAKLWQRSVDGTAGASQLDDTGEMEQEDVMAAVEGQQDDGSAGCPEDDLAAEELGEEHATNDDTSTGADTEAEAGISTTTRRYSLAMCNAPILNGSSCYSNPVPPLETMLLSASAQEGRVIPALRCMLTEIERVKLHGISEDEIRRVKLDILADLETAFLERNQTQSSEFASECIEHFLRDEPLMDLEKELDLCRRTLDTISAAEASECAKLHDWRQNCLVKVQLPSSAITASTSTGSFSPDKDTASAEKGSEGASAEKGSEGTDEKGDDVAHMEESGAGAPHGQEGEGLSESDIRSVFAEVAALSAASKIAPWPSKTGDQGLELPHMPPPAEVVERRDWTEEKDGCALTELVLSSGLRVLLKATDFLDDDLQFSAFAWQGISQLPGEELVRGRLARTVAEELGWAGIPREDLLDLLAGLRLSATPSIGAYNRSISGDCSPTDLVPLLQLARRLFSCGVVIDEDAMERLTTLRAVLRESILNRDKDPDGVFSRKVADVNTSSHSYFKPMEIADVDALADIDEARQTADVFNAAFGPGVGGWTLTMVGNFDVDDVLPELLNYFGEGPARDEADETQAPQQLGRVSSVASTEAAYTKVSGGTGSTDATAASAWLTPDRDGIKSLGVQFPAGPVNVAVERKMQGEPRARASITFPLTPIERIAGRLEALRALTQMDLAIAVLEKCLRERLRFDKGGVYGVSARCSYATSPPLPNEPLHGTLGIDFDCAPERQKELIETALEEFEKSRVECCAEERVSSMVEVLKRDHEESLRTNGKRTSSHRLSPCSLSGFFVVFDINVSSCRWAT